MAKKKTNCFCVFPVRFREELGLHLLFALAMKRNYKTLRQTSAHARCKFVTKLMYGCRSCWRNGPVEQYAKYIQTFQNKGT